MVERKSLPFSSKVGAIPVFLFMVLVALPLWLVMLAVTILWNILAYPFKLCSKKKASRKISEFVVPSMPSDVIPRDDREYDIILYGATGFTGGLAAKYLADNYRGTGLKWAIAGRKKASLLKVAQKIGIDVPIVIADSSKPDTLAAMVNSAKCVITTVGPFMRYGTPLVEMCALYGTDYSDITGEPDWVRMMIDRYDDIARESGARIVHFTGHDCVPWDLCAMKLGEALNRKGEKMVSIKCFDEINLAFSGGTLETMFMALENREKLVTSLGFDPLQKKINAAGDVECSQSKMKAGNQVWLGYRADAMGNQGSWVGNFVMAMVMANCVKHSNAVNGYSGDLRLKYYEAKVYPNFMAGAIEYISMMWFGLSFVLPPLKWFMRKYILPKPGQGPSDATMDAGWLRVTAEGKGDKGSKYLAKIYFPTDPGYRDTARMVVESGLALALEGDKITSGGGIFTPACCQKDVLLDRLLATGCTFDIQEFDGSSKSKSS